MRVNLIKFSELTTPLWEIQDIEKCTNNTTGMQSAKFRLWETSNQTTQVTSTKRLQEEKIKEKC